MLWPYETRTPTVGMENTSQVRPPLTVTNQSDGEHLNLLLQGNLQLSVLAFRIVDFGRAKKKRGRASPRVCPTLYRDPMTEVV